MTSTVAANPFEQLPPTKDTKVTQPPNNATVTKPVSAPALNGNSNTAQSTVPSDVSMSPSHLTDFVIHLHDHKFHTHKFALHSKSGFFRAHFLQPTIQSTTYKPDQGTPETLKTGSGSIGKEGVDFLYLPVDFACDANEFANFLDYLYYPSLPLFTSSDWSKSSAGAAHSAQHSSQFAMDIEKSELDRTNKATAFHPSGYAHSLTIQRGVLHCAVYFQCASLCDRAETAMLTHLNSQLKHSLTPISERKPNITYDQYDLAWQYLRLAHAYGFSRLKARTMALISEEAAHSHVGDRKAHLSTLDKDLLLEVMLSVHNITL